MDLATYHGVPIPEDIDDLDPVRVEAVKEVARLIDIEGLTQADALREVAPSLGITTRQLHRWAAHHGMPLPAPGANFGTRRMAEAVRQYAQTQRLEIGNRAMDLVEESLRRLESQMLTDPDFIPDPKELKELSTSFAILTDKRRLEDGDPTSRHEISSDNARERMMRMLSKLAERRKEVLGDTPELPPGEVIDVEETNGGN